MASFGLKDPRTEGVDRRGARRLRVLQQAKVVIGADIITHCEIRDLSSGGAKIAIARHVELPETFQLFICAHDLRVHAAWLRWRKGNLAGVSFVAPGSATCHSPIQTLAGSRHALVPSTSSEIPLTGEPRASALIRLGPYGRERRRRRYGRTAL